MASKVFVGKEESYREVPGLHHHGLSQLPGQSQMEGPTQEPGKEAGAHESWVITYYLSHA